MKTIRIKPKQPMTELRGFVASESTRPFAAVSGHDGAMVLSYPVAGDFVVCDEQGPVRIIAAAEWASAYDVIVEKKRGRKPKATQEADPRQLSVEGYLAAPAENASSDSGEAEQATEEKAELGQYDGGCGGIDHDVPPAGRRRKAR